MRPPPPYARCAAAAQRHFSCNSKHALRDLITFDLAAGDRIPTEAELCDHYHLSRITVRQAVTSPVDEGLLLCQQGRGTFVRIAR